MIIASGNAYYISHYPNTEFIKRQLYQVIFLNAAFSFEQKILPMKVYNNRALLKFKS